MSEDDTSEVHPRLSDQPPRTSNAPKNRQNKFESKKVILPPTHSIQMACWPGKSDSRTLVVPALRPDPVGSGRQYGLQPATDQDQGGLHFSNDNSLPQHVLILHPFQSSRPSSPRQSPPSRRAKVRSRTGDFPAGMFHLAQSRAPERQRPRRPQVHRLQLCGC